MKISLPPCSVISCGQYTGRECSQNSSPELTRDTAHHVMSRSAIQLGEVCQGLLLLGDWLGIGRLLANYCFYAICLLLLIFTLLLIVMSISNDEFSHFCPSDSLPSPTGRSMQVAIWCLTHNRCGCLTQNRRPCEIPARNRSNFPGTKG